MAPGSRFGQVDPAEAIIFADWRAVDGDVDLRVLHKDALRRSPPTWAAWTLRRWFGTMAAVADKPNLHLVPRAAAGAFVPTAAEYVPPRCGAHGGPPADCSTYEIRNVMLHHRPARTRCGEHPLTRHYFDTSWSNLGVTSNFQDRVFDTEAPNEETAMISAKLSSGTMPRVAE